jgi:hypothetical protein
MTMRPFRCDWRECAGYIEPASWPSGTLLALSEQAPDRRSTKHFCAWSCLLAYAQEQRSAQVPDDLVDRTAAVSATSRR